MTQTVDDDNVDDEEDEDEESVTVTANEVRQSFSAVRTYLQKTDIGNHVFDALVQVENAIDGASLISRNQEKITDFFK